MGGRRDRSADPDVLRLGWAHCGADSTRDCGHANAGGGPAVAAADGEDVCIDVCIDMCVDVGDTWVYTWV